MRGAKEMADVVNVLTETGYSFNAVELAAKHALISAKWSESMDPHEVAKDALTDLFVNGAVFSFSDAYGICIAALKVIDDAAKTGVELSPSDAVDLVTAAA